MRIAFYAPLKPPDHPVPSGDRQIARLLMTALRLGGHEVVLASRLRSFDPTGSNPAIPARGRAIAARWRCATTPDIWFTYHLYERAPDYLGPVIAARLGIPYVVAEASVSPRRAGPAQDLVIAALGQAAAVIGLNPRDEPCVLPHLAHPGRYHRLSPFVIPPPDRPKPVSPVPVLIAIGMMREGAKRASYRLLGAALERLRDRPWRLVVVGDGPARASVEAALSPLGDRVDWRGALPDIPVAMALAEADLCLWPAIDEAIGLALLEAQAASVAVVAGAEGGVPSHVRHGETGLLVAGRDPAAFAAAIAALLDDPDRCRAMGVVARGHILADHAIDGAARRLNAILAGLT